jgi:hypothetical protein
LAGANVVRDGAVGQQPVSLYPVRISSIGFNRHPHPAAILILPPVTRDLLEWSIVQEGRCRMVS